MDFGPYNGIVDLAHDGDTVNIRLDVGFDLTIYSRVRIQGINAPELSTAAGVVARDYARTLLPTGAKVKVVSHGWDKYGGRIDGTVTCPDGQDFATLMLASGNAVVYKG